MEAHLLLADGSPLGSPLQERLLVELDGLKQGRAQLAVKSVTATVFVVMMYILYTVVQIHSRCGDAVDSPNRAILAYLVLEASLIGFSLFLLLIIDGLHQYTKEVNILTKTLSAAQKQNQAYEEGKKKSANEAKSVKEKISRLRTEIKKLELECDRKENEVESRKANSDALKSRLEGLLVEYDGLLADNKDLKDQLHDMNERWSHSGGKKSGFFSWDQWGL
ncbi:uncharacterized protein LOC112516880 isoform X2 [Cynara cardunculus var. scolymus]|uniref:uncharacterized protein LOC112516880 isoform X2 n=1 Tax=Cynara cardunculus var. scolymus TaxID=59895 RepID=UPI000D626B20|nr:uncharacterized protein LOC112516880 isoform X2 [Cynara cardunculus var. scolymus]